MNCAKMRFLLIFLAILAGFVAASSAQSEATPNKFAEFGAIKTGELKQKMSDFRGALLRDPTNQGFIVIYGTPAQTSARRRLILRSMPIIYDDPTRITFVDGRGSRVRTILWIVPPGAKPPSP